MSRSASGPCAATIAYRRDTASVARSTSRGRGSHRGVLLTLPSLLPARQGSGRVAVRIDRGALSAQPGPPRTCSDTLRGGRRRGNDRRRTFTTPGEQERAPTVCANWPICRPSSGQLPADCTPRSGALIVDNSLSEGWPPRHVTLPTLVTAPKVGVKAARKTRPIVIPWLTSAGRSPASRDSHGSVTASRAKAASTATEADANGRV